nr:hypothetical protein [Tanacetum cinerariifolium]
QESTVAALRKYATEYGGKLEPADYEADNGELCVVAEENGNTTVLFLDGYAEMDKASKFLSQELSAAVFALHIHDGDFWLYTLYYQEDWQLLDFMKRLGLPYPIASDLPNGQTGSGSGLVVISKSNPQA